MQVCADCGEENSDAANFCLACGKRLAAAPELRQERKLITAVFIDLVGGPTAVGPVDPEDLAARIQPYAANVRNELVRHGATVEKFMGDAIVALFGAPVAREDDPERAVRGALAAFQTIAELNARDAWLALKIRVGINTGEALVDLDARAARGEGVASGDVMNTAARLQEAAPVNGILVGELTYEATRDVVHYRRAGPIDVRGKSEPVPVWEVIGLRRIAMEAAPTPFVGRDVELGRLVKLWNTAIERRRPVHAAVVGAPGTGKTRLLQELAASTAADTLRLWGHCLPYGEGITYWAIAEIVEAAAGIMRREARPALKVDTLLDGLGIEDEDQRRVLKAAALTVTGVSKLEAPAQLSQSELHWALRRLLQLLSRERPILIIVEDLQWAEPTMLDLLEYLASGEGGGYVIVGSSRESPPDAVRRHLEGTSLVVQVEPLDEGASRALLSALVGTDNVAGRTAASVLRLADGNPLFIEELVRMLRDREALGDPETDDLSALGLPSSLQALIGSRIDHLPPAQRQIAQYASIVGEVFWRGSLAHLMRGTVSDEALDDGLAGLERGGFVRQRTPSTVAGDEEWSFKHILVRDVAYSRIPKARRAELHLCFADWVRSLGDEELVEIIAWHLERACALGQEVPSGRVALPTRDAVAALSTAAERAKIREGWRETERYYARARELLADVEEGATELRLRHGMSLIGLGQVDRGRNLVATAKDEAIARGLLDLAAEATLTLCQVARRQGEGREARRYLDELEELTATLTDTKLLLRLRFMRAAVQADIEGAPEAAVAELSDAVAIAATNGETALLIEAHLRLAFVLYNKGQLARAEAEVRRCSELAAQVGNTRDAARAHCVRAQITYLRGDVHEAERIATATQELLARTGETFFEIQNLIALGQCALARSDRSVAETRLREALDLALNEDSFFIAEICRLLIEIYVDSDRIEEASELEAFAARRVQLDHPYARAAVHMGEAALASAVRNFPASAQHHRDALALLDRLAFPVEISQARLAYGQTLRRAGDSVTAREQLMLAREACTDMGATTLVRQVDHELALLETSMG